MSDRVLPTVDDLERAAQLVEQLDARERVASLVHELVERQAEGRVLYTGERFVNARAEARGVARKDAETPIGNVLGLLERGPQTRAEWALLSALHVRGLVGVLSERPDEHADLLARFVAHADWLEASTPYRPLAVARFVLPPSLCTELLLAIGRRVLGEDSEVADPAVCARNALRIAVLGRAASDPALTKASRQALGKIHNEARDAYSRALAAIALGEPPPAIRETRSRRSSFPPPESSAPSRPPPIEIAGEVGVPSRGGPLALLRWLSGYALLRALLTAISAVLGVRREAKVVLSGRALRVAITTRWLGRTVREKERVHALESLVFGRRVARYASLNLIVGALAFTSGLLAGGFLIVDGLRAGEGALLGAGAALVFGGAVLDLVLGVLVPAIRGRVKVDFDFGRGGRLFVVGVDMDDADRFMQALLERVSAR